MSIVASHKGSDVLAGTKSAGDWLEEFASLLVSRTGGNAFFIVEMIYDLSEALLLRFNWKERRWQFDPAGIQHRQVSTSDDVIEFVLRKMRDLSNTTQAMLCIVALFGSEVPARLFPYLSESMGLEESTAWIDEGRQAGMIAVANSGGVVFLHDRFQEAAVHLRNDPKFVHLRIAQALLKFLNLFDVKEPTLLEQRLDLSFSLVDHLLAAEELLPVESKMLQQLKSLCLSAADITLRQSAYEKAVIYLRCAARLEQKGREKWKLQLKLAETAWMSRHYAEAGELLNVVESTARDVDSLVDAKLAFISYYTLLEKYSSALLKGSEVIKLLTGSDLILDISFEQLNDFVRTRIFNKIAATGRDVADLFESFPISSDKRKLKFDTAICRLLSVAYLNQQVHLHTYLGALAVVRCLDDEEATILTASAIATFAFSCSADLFAYRTGYDLGKRVALPLLRRRTGGAVSMDNVVFLCCALVAQWGPSIGDALPLLSEVWRKEHC